MKKSLFWEIIAVILLFFIVSIYSCKSPVVPEIEIKPRASLVIAIKYEPVMFKYDFFFLSWFLNNSIIISETNGVGGHISTAKLDLMCNGIVLLTKNYEGRTFKAYESWESADIIYTNCLIDQAKVIISGKDNNDYSINLSKTWNVYYWDYGSMNVTLHKK